MRSEKEFILNYMEERLFMKRISIICSLFFAFVFFDTSVVKAQFYGSETVYCYKYVKTINDGISSKTSNPDYIFVNFQKDMMGIYYAGSDLNYINQKLLETPNFFEEKAIEDLANNYNEWKNPPPYGSVTMGVYRTTVRIIKYNDQFSTGSKYTYRKQRKIACADMYMFGLPNYYWGDESWESECFSFSLDKQEMIIWSTSDSENREYYELIDVDDLKPNTDFLD